MPRFIFSLLACCLLAAPAQAVDEPLSLIVPELEAQDELASAVLTRAFAIAQKDAAPESVAARPAMTVEIFDPTHTTTTTTGTSNATMKSCLSIAGLSSFSMVGLRWNILKPE